MDDTQIGNQINALLGTEVPGLARHLDEAKPFINQRNYRAWSVLREMGHAAADHAGRLTELLEELEVEPQPGAFGVDVANYHYMTVESILPLLIQEKEQQIAIYKRAAGELAGEGWVVDEVRPLLAENLAQLDRLRDLAAGRIPGAGAGAGEGGAGQSHASGHSAH